MTPGDFQAQMDWLAANHYHPITIADLRAYFQSGSALPSRPVVLTFDDGYADFYSTAFPILDGHHFKAVAYIVLSSRDEASYRKDAPALREVLKTFLYLEPKTESGAH